MRLPKFGWLIPPEEPREGSGISDLFSGEPSAFSKAILANEQANAAMGGAAHCVLLPPIRSFGSVR